MSTPAGDDVPLHELEFEVRSELILVETSLQEEETDGEPTVESLDEETQHYEVGLRALLGAIEAVEELEEA